MDIVLTGCIFTGLRLMKIRYCPLVQYLAILHSKPLNNIYLFYTCTAVLSEYKAVFCHLIFRDITRLILHCACNYTIVTTQCTCAIDKVTM